MRSFSILCLSKEFWANARKARKQFLFEALQKQSAVEEVLYVNPYHHRWRPHPVRSADNAGMRVHQGKYLFPGERFLWVRTINRFFAYRKLRKEMAKRVLWRTVFYDPWDVPLARHLRNHGKVFFDWTDDWSKYYGIPRMGEAQDSAVKMASGVIVVSERLEGRASELRGSDKEVLLLPNATTWKPADNFPSPEDILSIPSPRLGYLGHLGPWFDTDLVVDLAYARPQWHWVIVGPIDCKNQEHFCRIKNVHLLGQKPFDKLQAYMAQCQALVAPYHRELEGDATKLYDYLTLGHPVISTEIGTASRLRSYVRTATTTQSWINAIEQALQENDASLRLARQKESLRHNWDIRAAALLRWFSLFMNE